VRYPGSYPIRRGESLRSVVERAGGLTDLAYPRGAVFTREELREREQEQFDRLASRLQTDLSVFALQAAAANQGGASQSLAVGQSLLAQLTEAEAVGRLVINLDRALAAEPGSDDEIVLRAGDRLLVPKLIQSVSVIGEVQNSTAHLYNRELARDDYIALSGGTTRQADRRQIYVVKADGSVVASSGNRWFSRGNAGPLDPGDTVVVPLDAERLPPLPLWQAVTQILYNVAIAVAAVNSF
jgi:protein involved in polysaccharide export with SLBB domain